MTNQKINEMYMVKSKQQVVLGHNFIIIQNKKYMFQENNLIILKVENIQPDILLLKLYSDYVTNTKLTKFHFSNKHAVFFFLYRKDYKGVHFYLIISQQDLLLLLQKQECLIKEDTNIFIMKTIDSIEALPFNHDKIEQYCENDKYNNCSSNEFVFELTRDLADPTKDYFPFLFYQKLAECKFEIFLCFMNVENSGEYLIEKKQKE